MSSGPDGATLVREHKLDALERSDAIHTMSFVKLKVSLVSPDPDGATVDEARELPPTLKRA